MLILVRGLEGLVPHRQLHAQYGLITPVAARAISAVTLVVGIVGEQLALETTRGKHESTMGDSILLTVLNPAVGLVTIFEV